MGKYDIYYISDGKIIRISGSDCKTFQGFINKYFSNNVKKTVMCNEAVTEEIVMEELPNSELRKISKFFKVDGINLLTKKEKIIAKIKERMDLLDLNQRIKQVL